MKNSVKLTFTSSFFRRLLGSFLLVGTVPVLIISFVSIAGSSRFLDGAYEQRVRQAVSSAASLSQHLISEAGNIAVSLAAEQISADYAVSPEKSTFAVAGIKELIREQAGQYFDVFILPADGSAPVFNFSIPPQYADTAYRSWGIMKKLSDMYDTAAPFRTGGETILPPVHANGPEPALFGQPHSDHGDSVPIAAGTGIFSGADIAGYVIVDIRRSAFSDLVGLTVGKTGALNDLFILDESGCIVYSMIDARREALFFDEIGFDWNNVISLSRSISGGFTVVGTYPVAAVREFSDRFRSVAFITAAFAIAAAVLLTVLLSRSISRPVSVLTAVMRRVESGDLSARCPSQPDGSKEDLAFLMYRFNTMIEKINILVEDIVLKQKLLRTAETKALQSQINPHFLYNTLSSIRSMAKLQGAQDAAAMTTALARILREGFSPGEEMSTVEQSLKLAKDYFAIESYRWPGRFEYEEDIEPSILQADIPRLVIQPIVENALVHGLEKCVGTGVLRIEGRRENGCILITISDNGAGMDETELEKIRSKLGRSDGFLNDDGTDGGAAAGDGSPNLRPDTSAGIALVNTHRRLKLLYGEEAGLEIFSWPGEGTSVLIRYTVRGTETQDNDKSDHP